MHSLEQSSIEWILWLQAARSPALDALALGASGLGHEFVYMLLIPLLYWCVDRALGVRLFLFVIGSLWLGAVCKWMLAWPRPYWVAPEIQPMTAAYEFGAPSGHAQNALGVWLLFAMLLQRRFGVRWPFLIAALVAIATSWSRVYMGVHFVHDIWLGWALAIGLVIAFACLQDRVSSATHGGSHALGTLALTLLTALVMCAVTALCVSARGEIDPVWQRNAVAAHAALGVRTAFDPYDLRVVVIMIASLVGIGIALPIARRHAPFDPAGALGKRGARYVLGMLGVFVVYAGLAAVLPKAEASGYLAGRCVRYAALALFGFAGAPWLFLRLGLATREPLAEPIRASTTSQPRLAA